MIRVVLDSQEQFAGSGGGTDPQLAQMMADMNRRADEAARRSEAQMALMMNMVTAIAGGQPVAVPQQTPLDTPVADPQADPQIVLSPAPASEATGTEDLEVVFGAGDAL